MTAGNVFLADCPARLAVEIIADKWAVVVLYGLAGQPRRHGELASLIGGRSIDNSKKRIAVAGGAGEQVASILMPCRGPAVCSPA